MGLISRARQAWPTIQWELDGVDPIVLERVLRVFDVLTRAYPDVVKSISAISTKWHEPKSKDYFAVAYDARPDTMVGTTILLNPKYYGHLKEFEVGMQESVAKHIHPRNTASIEASFTHEFGHALMFWLLSVDRQGMKEWMRFHKANDDLSIYATVNDDEAWAEGFTALCFGSPPTAYTDAQKQFLSSIR